MPGMDLSGARSTRQSFDELKNKWGTPVEDREVSNSVNYADDVEYGTSSHTITPNSANALRFEMGGETVFAQVVHHPGTAPQPYWRPSVDATASEMGRIAVMSDSLSDYMDRLANYHFDDVVSRTPVDTGNLADGWEVNSG